MPVIGLAKRSSANSKLSEQLFFCYFDWFHHDNVGFTRTISLNELSILQNLGQGTGTEPPPRSTYKRKRRDSPQSRRGPEPTAILPTQSDHELVLPPHCSDQCCAGQ